MMERHSTCLLLFTFVSCIYSTVAATYYCTPSEIIEVPLDRENLSYVSSVNYPDALPDYFQKECTINIEPLEGYGVRMLFEGFFISPDDTLTIKTTIGEFTRTGSMDDPERGTVAFYMSPGTMSLIFQQKTPTATSIKHAGFKAILKPFDLYGDEAAQCGGERFINETYFITSFGYPQDYGSGKNCSWSFTADANIRILFYDFQSDGTTDSFIMIGQGLAATQNSTILSDDVTSDLPVAFYYRKTVQIHFTSGNSFGLMTRKFSFIIDSYPDSSSNDEKCVGDGIVHNMSDETSVAISTTNYVNAAYSNFLNCEFSFTNAPPSHIIYVNMVFESERCCDTMVVNGIGQDFIFQGERYPMVYFANNENVSLVFTSDGVRTAAGFQGIVSTMDCGCQNVTINIVDGKDRWIESPAYGTAPTYCPRLNCLWEVRFPHNITLDISSFSMGLRMGDVLSITDSNGDQIASYSISSNSASEKFMATISTGYIAFHFTSVPLDYVETSAQIGGFRIRMQPNWIVYNRSESISLANEDNVASVSAIIIPGQAFLWHVQARINRTVTLYVFGSLGGTGAVLDVFDGPTVDSPLLPVSEFYNSTTSSHMVSEIHSSGVELTFRVIGSSRMPSSYQFFGLLSDIVDHSYADHCSEPLVKGFTSKVITNIMRPSNASLTASSTTQDNSTTSANSTTSNEASLNPTCFIVFHGVAKSLQLRSGLTLEVIGASTAVEIYKGTTLARNALLASSPPYPDFIFGNDVTFAYPAIQPPDTIAVVSTVMLRDYTELPTNNETIGYLFSPDFLSDTDLGRIYQRYVLSIEEEPLNGFQIEVMNSINNCQILIEGDYDGTPTLYDELLSGAPSRNVCVTNMAVIYRSNGGVGKGMFLKYRKGLDNYCKSVISDSSAQYREILMLPIVALVILSLVL